MLDDAPTELSRNHTLIKYSTCILPGLIYHIISHICTDFDFAPGVEHFTNFIQIRATAADARYTVMSHITPEDGRPRAAREAVQRVLDCEDVVTEIAGWLQARRRLPLALTCHRCREGVRRSLRGAALQSSPVYFASSVPLLRWALAAGCPCTLAIAVAVVQGGHTDVFQWLTATYDIKIVAWMTELCRQAAQHGHLGIVQLLWARQPAHTWWRHGICHAAAQTGRLHVLQWLRETASPPCPWSFMTCQAAAAGGHLEVLKWLRRSASPPCPWGESACTAAAKAGNLTMLRWMRLENDPPCPWNAAACSEAALGGHIEILRWLRTEQPPCPWDARTTAGAALMGDTDMLEWLRMANDPPCPWDSSACHAAASEGYLSTLRWLRARGCPVDAQSCYRAAYVNGHRDTMQWLVEEEDAMPLT